MSILTKFSRAQLNVRDFEFIRAIGKGGFGSVYLAQRADNKKLSAIKVVNCNLLFACILNSHCV